MADFLNDPLAVFTLILGIALVAASFGLDWQRSFYKKRQEAEKAQTPP